MKDNKLLITILMAGICSTNHLNAASVCGANEDNCWECGTNCVARLNNGNFRVSVLDGAESASMKYFYAQGYAAAPWRSSMDSITSITVDNGVSNISNYAFLNASNLRSVSIPNSVTTIDGGAFEGTTSLSSVTLPNNLTSLRDKAFYKSGLTSIDIPDSVTSIGTQALSGESGVRSPLKYVNFGENSQLKTCNDAFSWTSMSSIDLPYGLETIGSYTFYGTPIKSITIPNSVTTIGSYSFWSSSFNDLIIPSSVTKIGAAAFYGFDTNASILIEGKPEIEADSFFPLHPNMKIYCLDDYSACHDYLDTRAVYYTNENGLYKTTADGKYFASGELMMADTNGDKACKDKAECLQILATLQAGKSFISNGKFYKSLSDWATGNYEKKRIYTVQEANQVSKPTGNRVSIRYK